MGMLVLGEARGCVRALVRVIESFGWGAADFPRNQVTDRTIAGSFKFCWPLLTSPCVDGLSTVCVLGFGTSALEDLLHPVRILLLESLGRYRGGLTCMAGLQTSAAIRTFGGLGFEIVPVQVAAVTRAIRRAKPLSESRHERGVLFGESGDRLYLAAIYRLAHLLKDKLLSRSVLEDNCMWLPDLLIRVQGDLAQYSGLSSLASCLDAGIDVARQPRLIERESFRTDLKIQLGQLNNRCSGAFGWFEKLAPFDVTGRGRPLTIGAM